MQCVYLNEHGVLKRPMLITHPALLRIFNQAQATYSSVYHREDGRGFSIKFTKGGKEFMFYAKLVLGDEHLQFSVPRELLRTSCLTMMMERLVRWDPCTGNQVPDTAYNRLVLNGCVLNAGFVTFFKRFSPELDDVIAGTLLHLMNQLQSMR